MEVSRAQAAWCRLRRSGLVGSVFGSAADAAAGLGGVQAQFEPPAGLAIRNRVGGFDAEALESALVRRRTLVKTWGQRSTLHLYSAQDWPLFTSALLGAETWWTRRLGRREVERTAFDAALETAAAWLRRNEGAHSRHDLREALPELRPWLEVGAGLIFDLARRGVTCHAGWDGSKARFAHRDFWLPGLAWDPPPPADACRELARRYLAAYGPADARDFAFWLGIKATPARAAISALGAGTTEVELEGRKAFVLDDDVAGLTTEPHPPETWPPRLLHRFDAVLLALRDKRWLIDERHYKRVWRKAGYVEAVILVRGRIDGTWRYDKVRGGLRVTLEPFGRLAKALRRMLEREAASLAGYFGVPLAAFEVM